MWQRKQAPGKVISMLVDKVFVGGLAEVKVRFRNRKDFLLLTSRVMLLLG